MLLTAFKLFKMNYEIIEGDCFQELRRLADGGAQFDAIIAAPPYCSGGFLPALADGKDLRKYVKSTNLGQFNDSMNIRALMNFTRDWIWQARRCLKSPGYFFLFTDWRMLPTFSDAISLGEIVQRGILTWNKKNSRPNKGHFSQTSEFVLWGTKDKLKSDKFVVKSVFTQSQLESDDATLDELPNEKTVESSVFTVAAPAIINRIHPTQKSVEIIAELLRILPDDATSVCDPFSGSGTTGVAAINAGLDYVGIERDATFAARSRKRLDAAFICKKNTDVVVDKPKGNNKPLFKEQ